MLAVHQDNLRKVIRSIDGDPLALQAEKTLGLELMKEIRDEMKMPMPTLEGKEPTTHESASSGQAPAKKGLAPAGTSVDDENLKSLSAALAEQMASGLVPAASPPPADTAKTPSSAATAEQMASGLEPAGKNTAMSPTPAKKMRPQAPTPLKRHHRSRRKGPPAPLRDRSRRNARARRSKKLPPRVGGWQTRARCSMTAPATVQARHSSASSGGPLR